MSLIKEYPLESSELIASKKALLKVRTYLNDVLEDVNYCDTVPESGILDRVNDAWFSGRRMELEDAMKHIDNMVNDIDTDIEAL